MIKNLLNNFWITLTIIFSLCLSANHAGASEIFAKVGGQEITKQLFQDSLRLTLSSSYMLHGKEPSEKSKSRAKLSTADILIDRELILHSARKLDIAPGTVELQTNYEEKIKMYGSEEGLNRYLDQYKISRNGFRKITDDVYTVNFFITNHLVPGIYVTEEQCLEYYQDNLKSYAPRDTYRLDLYKFRYNTDGSNYSNLDLDIQKIANSDLTITVRKKAVNLRRRYPGQLSYEVLSGIRLDEDPKSFLWNAISDVPSGRAIYIKDPNDRSRSYVAFLFKKVEKEKTPFEAAKGEIRKKLRNSSLRSTVKNHIAELREGIVIEIVIDPAKIETPPIMLH